MNGKTQRMPEHVRAITRRGYVVWAADGRPADSFRKLFDANQIPVMDVRHVRIWGVQVDDERELPGHERTSIPDEELWEIKLQARDGSCYEVESTLVRPAPD